MEESDQKNVTNESTSPEVDVNTKETIENDEMSISKPAADLCDLKQINCEVGAKETSESCPANECNEEQSKENEICSNPSNESQEEQKNDENRHTSTPQDDQENRKECCAVESNEEKSKQCCQSPASISEENEENSKECCAIESNVEKSKQCCQSPASISEENEENSNECCALENKEEKTKQCCQIPASPQKLKQCCQSPSRAKESTSSKPKRKSRSTRRRLNAMISNSLHFSDTDSEGELIIMETHVRGTSPAKQRQGPVISVTMDDIEGADKPETNSQCLAISSTSEVTRSRRGSFTENLTDVDEIYTSEPENEQKIEGRNSLTVAENAFQAETDVEDMSNDEGEPAIYVAQRSDILCDFSGETITTKEGDGPFSVEIRNSMSKEMEVEEGAAQKSPDIVIMPNTDSEDMEMSDEEDLQVASCSQRELFEDLDVLAASQIVMTNVNKTTDTLGVKDTQEDVSIGDCHTDVEDVDCAE